MTKLKDFTHPLKLSITETINRSKDHLEKFIFWCIKTFSYVVVNLIYYVHVFIKPSTVNCVEMFKL